MRQVLYVSLLASIFGVWKVTGAHAVNYDRISFFEEPLAVQTDIGTFSINSLMDWEYRSEDNDNARFDTRRFVGQTFYSHQLDNNWDIGASYLADYSSERRENYEDEFRMFVRDRWGLISIGEIATQLFDETGRQPATGLLSVENDNFILPLETYGVHYAWSAPTVKLLASVDESANVEAGVSDQRVIGKYRLGLSLRFNRTDDPQGNAQGVRESNGIALVGRLERGRWSGDVQFMSEDVESLDRDKAFRLNTVSFGVHYRFDSVNWSLTGIARENVLDDEERILALGLRMDLARGLSFNSGARISTTKLLDDKFRTYAASIRYEF